MKRFVLNTGAALALGLGLTLTLLWLLGGPSPARASPASTVRYVATTGTDGAVQITLKCSNPLTPCRTVQHAVNVSDWATNDEIRVATGVYTSSSGQVLYIQNELSIRGGYTTTDWTRPHPVTQPTTLDGRGQMRVILIQNASADITPTLEGLQVTNGAVDGDGGGIRATAKAHAIISGCHIFSNTVTGTSRYGGGVYIGTTTNARLLNNEIYSNTATGNGGAGGGVALHDVDDATLAGNNVYGNVAYQVGGGIYLDECANLGMANNMVVENRLLNLSAIGAGIHAGTGTTAHMLHTTLARNSGGIGEGIYVAGGTTWTWLTNTILVSHTIGVRTNVGGMATLTYTLWGTGTWRNLQDTLVSSGSIVTGASAFNWWEEPGFLDPDGGNYHIGTTSEAINKALSAGVSTDVDGEPRPFCEGSDLGADEYGCCANLDGALYSTVQAAVDAGTLPTDVVKVAGTCSGVNDRGGFNQTVYVSKTVTVRGGYTTSDWNTSDPQANPTTLDAVAQGRVVRIQGPPADGTITPTLEGLRITGASYTGGSGGGIYAEDAHPIVNDCQILNNTAKFGGGIYLADSSNARLVGNTFLDNTATWWGGGAYIDDTSSNATLTGNTFSGNAAAYVGGGLAVDGNDATLTNNMIVANQLTDSGTGAGISLITATGIRGLHTTIARNSGGNGEGIYMTGVSSLWMTNTILVSHTVGIDVHGGAAYLTATLWGEGAWANITDTIEAMCVTLLTGTVNVRGDPAFVNPDGGDYHIGAGSAAINAGVDTGITDDIDGDPRVGPPDLGADEGGHAIYLPLVLKN